MAAGSWASAILNGPASHATVNAVDLTVTAVTGSPYHDLLIGDGRANQLSGGGGNDWIRGEAGIDTLDGGAGRDTLVGGAGDDLLISGAAEDRFLLASIATGDDRVQDFTDSADKLVFDISETGVDAFSDLSVSLLGGKVTIAWSPGTAAGVIGTGSVTLENVTNPALITASDVEFLA